MTKSIFVTRAFIDGAGSDNAVMKMVMEGFKVWLTDCGGLPTDCAVLKLTLSIDPCESSEVI